jgi:hypothetical protein
MPVHSVKVKWQKDTWKGEFNFDGFLHQITYFNFSLVDLDTDAEVLDFKAQLYALSNVPIERQKIMCGGKTLKDDEWNIPVKNVSSQIFQMLSKFHCESSSL